MPTVEGFTPAIFWTTIYGFMALCLLFMIVFKVYEAIKTIQTDRKRKREAEKPDFAEEVSRKVIEKLEPRFSKIEENLDKDKSRLDTHEAVLNGMRDGQKEIRDGLTAMCKFLIVAGAYGSFGDDPKIKEANADLQKFLAERM